MIIDIDELQRIGKNIITSLYKEKLTVHEKKYVLESILMTINLKENFRQQEILKDVLENKN